jgi:tRNA G18 (ribose-2'-O)-methylase SpoU
MRGYFEIGIFNGKVKENLGTLWRSAFQMGASGIYTIGQRYSKQASDTYKTSRHIPLRQFQNIEEFLASQPTGCPLVGIEMGGTPIAEFKHPESAIYLLGSEDGGIPRSLLERCQHVVNLPSIRVPSYNVAVAGSLVMYDRLGKRGWPTEQVCKQ